MLRAGRCLSTCFPFLILVLGPFFYSRRSDHPAQTDWIGPWFRRRCLRVFREGGAFRRYPDRRRNGISGHLYLGPAMPFTSNALSAPSIRFILSFIPCCFSLPFFLAGACWFDEAAVKAFSVRAAGGPFLPDLCNGLLRFHRLEQPVEDIRGRDPAFLCLYHAAGGPGPVRLAFKRTPQPQSLAGADLYRGRQSWWCISGPRKNCLLSPCDATCSLPGQGLVQRLTPIHPPCMVRLSVFIQGKRNAFMDVRTYRADALLLLTATIWGFAFVAQRVGMDYVGPFTFNGVCFALGSLSLVPLLFLMDRKSSPASALVPRASRRTIFWGGRAGRAVPVFGGVPAAGRPGLYDRRQCRDSSPGFMS